MFLKNHCFPQNKIKNQTQRVQEYIDPEGGERTKEKTYLYYPTRISGRLHKYFQPRGTQAQKYGTSRRCSPYTQPPRHPSRSPLSPCPLFSEPSSSTPKAARGSGQAGGGMKVSIKSLNGSSFEIEVEPTSKVRHRTPPDLRGSVRICSCPRRF